MPMGAWLDYIGGVMVSVMALLLLFEGMRRLVHSGPRKSTIGVLAGGLVLSLALGGIAYLKHRLADDAIESLSQPVFSKHMPLPDGWGGKCCKSTLEVESRTLVQAAFVESGRLYTYFDSLGKRVPFVPSEKDIREREEHVVLSAQLDDASRARLSEAVFFLVAAILSALIGAVLGYEQRKASANNTAETVARKNRARGSP